MRGLEFSDGVEGVDYWNQMQDSELTPAGRASRWKPGCRRISHGCHSILEFKGLRDTWTLEGPLKKVDHLNYCHLSMCRVEVFIQQTSFLVLCDRVFSNQCLGPTRTLSDPGVWVET